MPLHPTLRQRTKKRSKWQKNNNRKQKKWSNVFTCDNSFNRSRCWSLALLPLIFLPVLIPCFWRYCYFLFVYKYTLLIIILSYLSDTNVQVYNYHSCVPYTYIQIKTCLYIGCIRWEYLTTDCAVFDRKVLSWSKTNHLIYSSAHWEHSLALKNCTIVDCRVEIFIQYNSWNILTTFDSNTLSNFWREDRFETKLFFHTL